jgi:hypothetical protein
MHMYSGGSIWRGFVRLVILGCSALSISSYPSLLRIMRISVEILTLTMGGSRLVLCCYYLVKEAKEMGGR